MEADTQRSRGTEFALSPAMGELCLQNLCKLAGSSRARGSWTLSHEVDRSGGDLWTYRRADDRTLPIVRYGSKSSARSGFGTECYASAGPRSPRGLCKALAAG